MELAINIKMTAMPINTFIPGELPFSEFEPTNFLDSSFVTDLPC
jgi:hypothetical protein